MKTNKILNIVIAILMATFAGNLFADVTGFSAFITVPVIMGLAMIPVQKGVLMFNFANLEWSDGMENMGGLKVTGYYAVIADVDNFPELPANPSTPEEEVTLESTTGFTMKTGKNFLTIYSTMETSEVVDEPQGEIDGQSFINKATIFYPGTKAEALAFAKNVNNSNMVFIFEEASGGNRRVIGSKAFPAKCKVTVNSGKATADRKGISLEIFSYGYTPAPLYTGTIPLTPAT